MACVCPRNGRIQTNKIAQKPKYWQNESRKTQSWNDSVNWTLGEYHIETTKSERTQRRTEIYEYSSTVQRQFLVLAEINPFG